MAWYIRWSPWIAGYLLAFFILFFAGATWLNVANFLSSATTIGWVSATATFSAAISALYLARRSERLESEKKKKLGTVCAAADHAKLQLALAKLSDLRLLYPRHSEGLKGSPEELFPGTCHKLLEVIDILRTIELEKIAAYSEDIEILVRLSVGMLSNAVHYSRVAVAFPGVLWAMDESWRRIRRAMWLASDAHDVMERRTKSSMGLYALERPISADDRYG
ncbi:hypothetical protein [Achromobacter xylosoxidans]|uniref:hypothetical protein n=1 Tax=Alcaligenes xylosoxydans xylosoxydans TaxID=85698 RepID=UPI0006C87B5A|nr:hypothetical protein [Achromobacter xylosoxidans]MCH4576055.1 hypothetical protein [Achromobacter xylosoxidans]MDD7989011.1 hypothetical protein [Achromobacter xylosoxidans]NEV05064.1 hypothetical protein [Achromobacter xylosoxidans]OFO61323.1 hypothetical protein HMPREF3024_23950 [Achromobacter xylosoxidans]OMG79559.1 hypothetical protein BIZ53_11550 [Achromobacter xylosoxidans]